MRRQNKNGAATKATDSPTWLIALRAAEAKKAAEFRILDLREVVEDVEDPDSQMPLSEAKELLDEAEALTKPIAALPSAQPQIDPATGKPATTLARKACTL